MPSVADLRLPASPIDEPLTYPGATIDANYLLLGSWCYDMAPVLGVGPGQWEIRVDGGPLNGSGTSASLDDALTAIGPSALSERRPVMAYGSNGAPAQLLEKFAGLGRQQAVPVLRGVVKGLALAHSPHISPPGYVPLVLVRSSPDVALRVFVLLLDPAQLEVLNRTEPNYRLVAIDGLPIAVETGEEIASYHAYRGSWGALRWSASAGSSAPDTQPRLFARLGAMDWFTALVGAGDPCSVASRLAGDSELRDRVRRELAERHLVVSDGLGPVAGERP